MDLDKRKKLLWFCIIGMLFLLLMIAFGTSGCSKGNGDESNGDADVTDVETNSGKSDAPSINFAAVREDILESMRGTYAGTDVEIVTVELEAGNSDCARITVHFPDHSDAQAVLAGFRILRDNFPKLKRYVACAYGREYECEWNVLAYIASKGWTIDIGEEDAETYMEIVKSGIPKEDVDKPISVEAI